MPVPKCAFSRPAAAAALALALSGCLGGGGSPTVSGMPSAGGGTPDNTGLTGGTFTVQPGATVERGNVVIRCPENGPACRVSVDEDGTPTTSGGTPVITAALAPLAGLTGAAGVGTAKITLQPGASVQRGNVLLACPGGGSACVLAPAAGGALRYEKTGGTPAGAVVPSGTAASAAEPVLATAARPNTLAAALPVASNGFAPLSATLTRTFGTQPSVEPDGESHVKTVASDGDDGFRVTYVFRGSERTVHFRKTDYNSDNDTYHRNEDGDEFWFASLTGAFRGTEKDKGSQEFRYFDGGVFTGLAEEDGVNVAGRAYLAYGSRTAGPPAGSATWTGRMLAAAWQDETPAFASRQRIRGGLNLTADFGEGTLGGRFSGIDWTAFGEAAYRSLGDGTRFVIEDGRIAGGRFTAALRGTDTDADAAPADSARGFTGGVLGEFYGPAAEEIGGVFNARRANAGGQDTVMHGWFGGEQLKPTVPSGTLTVLSTAVAQTRSPPGTSAVPDAEPVGVVAVAGDGAAGFRVTWRDGSDRKEVHLEGSDFGSNGASSTSYHERQGDRAWFLWDWTDSFTATPEFDHFNVNGWAVVDYRAGTSDTLEWWRGYAVSGAATGADDLPSGTASYSGRAVAEINPAAASGNANRTYARGALALNADFGANTVGGTISGITVRDPGERAYEARAGSVTISGGTISGGSLTAAMSGTVDQTTVTGSVAGRFFGPQAAEVGGTLTGTGTSSRGNSFIRGWFGGKKQ